MGGVAYGTGREALLEAVIRIVATQGLRGLTYRSVAAEAGVTHGSVRYHFGNRDTLIEEALVSCVERSVAGIELTSPPGAGFSDLAAGLVDMVARSPEVQAFQYELSLEARRRPALLPVMARVNDTYRAAIHDELLRNGIDEPDLDELVFVVLDGLVFHQTVFGDTARTQRTIEVVRDLLDGYAGGALRSRSGAAARREPEC